MPRPLEPAWPRLALALVAAAALALPFDSGVARFFAAHQPAGDAARELTALQQFGQGSIAVIVVLAIVLLDPARRGRLWDWAAAVVLCQPIVHGMKLLIGRPRPRVAGFDSWIFLGPWRTYPIRGGDGGLVERHAWEFWAGTKAQLWSMPSSHTIYAVLLSVALARLYPRLTPLAAALACVVALARVVFAAHYPSDVLVGAAIGLGVGTLSMDRALGRRALAALGPSRAAARPDTPG